MKIGILGGSFDPIHNGHLHMAKEALREYQLDEIWLMPAGHSPNKNEANMTPANIRKEMCILACRKEANIKVCSLEIDADETSYTYLTLQKLSARYPMHQFFFLMGADSLAYFEQWVHPEIISELAILLVMNRNEYSLNELEKMANNINRIFPCDIRFVHCSKYKISSSEIRNMIKSGRDVSFYLSQAVTDYIKRNHLYE